MLVFSQEGLRKMVWCTGVDEMVFSGSMHLRQLNSAKKKVSYVSQSIPCHTLLPYSHTSFSYVPRPLCVLQGPIRVKYSPVCMLWQQDGVSDSLSNELVRSGHGARRFTVLFVFLGKGRVRWPESLCAATDGAMPLEVLACGRFSRCSPFANGL